jgi:glycosyltransferase involved in cell wall biosynthesis
MTIATENIRKLSIIIPCYNEVENIADVIDKVAAVNVGLEKEIIVVDDGSVDGTMKVLEEMKEQKSGSDVFKVHFSMLNSGKGFAIRIGLRYATGEIVIIQDADLEYDPNDYPKILEPILKGEADVVYGSRFMGKSRPEGMAFMNWVANRLLAIMATILYGKHITDEATCYKAFRRDVIDSVELTCQRFEFCPEVTSKVLKKKYRLVEVPINYQGRTTLEGKKITWWDGIVAIWTLLKYRFRR